MRKEGGDMNEIASFRARCRFSLCTPAYFADARQDVCDRLLLSVMVNSCTRSRFNLERTAPDCRSDAQCRRDSRATFGARRLCCFMVEFIRADDMDCGGGIHGVPDHFEIGGHEVKWRQIREPLNWGLENSLRFETASLHTRCVSFILSHSAGAGWAWPEASGFLFSPNSQVCSRSR